MRCGWRRPMDLMRPCAGARQSWPPSWATTCCSTAAGANCCIQPIAVGNANLIELLAIDRGRGMQNVESCMKDGYSTGGTAGTGLGAVRRLAAEFDLYSVADAGTVVMARVGARAAGRFGAVSVPVAGERECGDSWRLAMQGGITAALVVDGLGHGTLAAQAALCSTKAFEDTPFEAPKALIERMHRSLVGTRGAAAACAHVDGLGNLSYAGVGNISAVLITYAKSQGLSSHNGTLGLRMPRLQQFEYQRAPGTMVVMHTDGISSRWDLARKNGLLHRHPATVAAVLYRDHARGRDDATVLVFA